MSSTEKYIKKLVYQRKYNEINKEYIKDYQKKYYNKNKEKIQQKVKSYSNIHKDYFKGYFNRRYLYLKECKRLRFIEI